MTKAGTTTELAIWDIVPNIQMPDLTALSFDDLLSAAKNAWTFGRMTHEVAVVIFREIMERYDGRKSNPPPMKVEEAFSSTASTMRQPARWSIVTAKSGNSKR